jgi:hypothetical protein
MTWRALIIGIIGVAGLCLLTPVNDYVYGNTFLTGNHFPVGVFFFLVVLTLGANLVLKLARRRWMLKQAELMLVYCMMLVASAVPSSGLMRNWLPLMAAGPYMAQRADLAWEDDVLKVAPRGILVSNDMKSVAARGFFEGTPGNEKVRVPWGRWARPFITWGVYIWLYFLGTIFLCSMLRKQWVESERLTFPVARVPLDLTEGSGEGRLLLPAMRSTPFLVAVALTFAFGLIRLAPLFFGAEEGWRVRLPLWEVLHDIPGSYITTSDGRIFPLAIGFAFLVPSDVSLGIWSFHLFAYAQAVVAYSIGRPLEGGRAGTFASWQQSGAFLALTASMLWMARRHLGTVLMTECGRAPGADDSCEPIGYRLSFWGLVFALVGIVAWNVHFGVAWWAALALEALTFAVVLVHCRTVAQGGLFFSQQSWSPSAFLNGVTGGGIFPGPAAVVAKLQGAFLVHDTREILGPYVMNSLMISSVFERRRRWLLGAMLLALLVALPTATYASMKWVYYKHGGLNLPASPGNIGAWVGTFESIHLMISAPSQSANPSYAGLASGVALMGGLMFLRGKFYWWPVHPLGFAMAASWSSRELWFSFMLGWLAKVLILKVGGGRMLRQARNFFIGVIITESVMVGLATFVSLLTGVRTGAVFLSH